MIKYLFYFFIFLVSSSLYGVAPGTYCSTTPIDFTVNVRKYDVAQGRWFSDWVENIPVSEDLSFCFTVPSSSYYSVSFSTPSIQTPSDIILPIKDEVNWYAATAWNVSYQSGKGSYYDSACSIAVSFDSSYVGPIYRSVLKTWAGSFGDVITGGYSCVYMGSFSSDGNYLAPTVAQEELNKSRRYEVTLSSGEYTWEAFDSVSGSFYSGNISVPISDAVTYTNIYYGYFSSTLSSMVITASSGQSMPYRVGSSGFTPATNEFSLLNSSITGPSYEVDPGDPPDDIDDAPEIEVPDVPDPTLEEFPDSDAPASLPTPDPNDTDPLLTISANLVLSSNELASSINEQSNLLKTGFTNMASLQGALKSQTAEGFNSLTASVNAQTKKQVQIGNAILQGQHDQTGKLLEGMNNITRSVDALKSTGEDSGEGSGLRAALLSGLREFFFGDEDTDGSGTEGKAQALIAAKEGEVANKLLGITGSGGSVDEVAPPACGPCTGFPTITLFDKPYVLDPFIHIPSFAGMASSCYNFLSYIFLFGFVYKCVRHSPPTQLEFGFTGLRSGLDLAPGYSQIKNNIVTSIVLTIMVGAYASLFFWIFNRSGGITSNGSILNVVSSFHSSNPIFCSISQFIPIGLLISYSLSFLAYTIFYNRIIIGARALIAYIRSI